MIVDNMMDCLHEAVSLSKSLLEHLLKHECTHEAAGIIWAVTSSQTEATSAAVRDIY